MVRIIIEFEPASGQLQMTAPDNLGLTLALLDRVRARVQDQALAAARPSVREAFAAELNQLGGNGR